MTNFRNLLDEAVSWTEGTADALHQNLRDAITSRLIFRREFLLALAHDADILQNKSTGYFASCLSQLSSLTKSVSLGKPVSDAFSVKIQRRLASTVPPRPMVKVSFEDALAHLRRLCRDAIDLQELVEYGGPYNFKVFRAIPILKMNLNVSSNEFRSPFGHCFLENLNHPFISVRLPKLSS